MPHPALVPPELRLSTIPSDSRWNRENPYPARVHLQHLLTTPDATKQVLHLEVDLGDSGMHYQCGDTLAIRITNEPALVDEMLAVCGLAGDNSMAAALLTGHEITQVHAGFFKHYATYCRHAALQSLVADSKALRAYMENRQIIDVLREFPTRLSAEQLRSCLRNLQDRQYSIASSPQLSPTTVALTVGLLQFDCAGHQRRGAGSGYLSQRTTSGSTLPVYVVSNNNFRLPDDPAAAIIMIGPGTGIAPFRGFLQDRAASAAAGKNWLFTGFRRRQHDFLYGEELLDWQQCGVLARLDVAFSRDQHDKVYVQDLLQQHGAEVFDWLQHGAFLYVCGDARHMAEDVQKQLLALIEKHGRLDAGAARQYLVNLRQQKRYQRDVY
jgi:sulfite reductase (NADPH) flavoprotein alpha-component